MAKRQRSGGQKQRASRGDGRWRKRFWRIAAVLLIALIVLPLLVVASYRFINPPVSALMVSTALAGKSYNQQWVPLVRISPYLIRGVVMSEDARFCSHWGVDWKAIEKAIDDADKRGGWPRGASTIPMQTVKNLFLWQDRSYLRKAIEIPLAYTISAFWPKRRILEVYLNVAEWAPGVFGAEAAARHHFKMSAIALTRRQAAQMVAALPNPHKRNAGRPGPRTRRLAQKIEGRMSREAVQLDCVLQ